MMKNLNPLTLSASNSSPFGIMKSILRAFNEKVIFLRALSQTRPSKKPSKKGQSIRGGRCN
jgi:hypothetical protein